ncbi:Hypothetical predicted protein [Paramuricea clavata]|uniref:Uncharacterized protein n=2 Tax=Paramuricea clavata TaxID=317549 RepID=A0A6S7IER0_PARCT|nr:Hypothetical predicted protein [Paramuricea clavata]
MSHACEQSFGATNGIPLGDTVGTARMEERKPQLEDELEQLRTKEEFTNFIKKYFAIKQEEVDSLNTELANVRETLQAKIEELIYAYDQECSLRLQINGMQHGEKSKDPNQVRKYTVL